MYNVRLTLVLPKKQENGKIIYFTPEFFEIFKPKNETTSLKHPPNSKMTLTVNNVGQLILEWSFPIHLYHVEGNWTDERNLSIMPNVTLPT